MALERLVFYSSLPCGRAKQIVPALFFKNPVGCVWNRFIAAARGSQCGLLWFSLGYLGQLRKINVECGSVTDFAVNIDPALMLLHDAKTVANPRPVPLPASLVVKNGSKIRGRTSGGMPQPVSLTLKHTNEPELARLIAHEPIHQSPRRKSQ